MRDSIEKLSKSVLATLQFFESKLQKDGSYGAEISDLSHYYKSPMMFIIANKPELAARILNYLKSNYMTETGDFITRKWLKSAKPEYAEFWSYTNGWIVRAAQQLKMEAITIPAYKYLSQFNQGQDNGFITNNPDLKNGITDILTTAHHGLIYLEHGDKEIAKSAGNYLCNAIENQPNLTEILYLRFDRERKPITQFENNQAAFYCIDKTKADQLYFMIGYPSAYLALLCKETKCEKYLNVAKEYLNFALTSHESVFHSSFSHKIAWAASLLYEMTGDENYKSAIEKICNYFLNIQGSGGMWYLDADLNTAYDQSAEIACWFMEISKNLQGCINKCAQHASPICR